MSKCLLCGKEFDNGRAMHMHMLKLHRKEYQEQDYDLKPLTEGYNRKPTRHKYRKFMEENIMAAAEKKDRKAPKLARPPKLRILNKNDPDELVAYNDGYRYIDQEEFCYTSQEVRDEGWL